MAFKEIDLNSFTPLERLLIEASIKSEEEKKSLSYKIYKHFFPEKNEALRLFTRKETIEMYLEFDSFIVLNTITIELKEYEASDFFHRIGKDEFNSYRTIYKIYRIANPFFDKVDYCKIGREKYNKLIIESDESFKKYLDVEEYLKRYFIEYYEHELKKLEGS